MSFIDSLVGEVVVIKYGGSAMTDEKLKRQVAEDIELLRSNGVKVVLVHGGGPKINQYLEKFEVDKKFVNGRRVSDQKTIDIVQTTLWENVAKELSWIIPNSLAVWTVNPELIQGEYLDRDKYGYVGQVKSINTKTINTILSNCFTPIISPIAMCDDEKLNINADFVACDVAVAMKAKKLILLTNVEGVLEDYNDKSSLIREIKLESFDRSIIKGGMLPKIDACEKAISKGVESIYISDGRQENAIINTLFGTNGTKVVK